MNRGRSSFLMRVNRGRSSLHICVKLRDTPFLPSWAKRACPLISSTGTEAILGRGARGPKRIPRDARSAGAAGGRRCPSARRARVRRPAAPARRAPIPRMSGGPCAPRPRSVPDSHPRCTCEHDLSLWYSLLTVESPLLLWVKYRLVSRNYLTNRPFTDLERG